jgi:hypothetical protein
MKRTCLQKNTNTNEQTRCTSGTCEFHPVKPSVKELCFDPTGTQQVKSFVLMKETFASIIFCLLVIAAFPQELLLEAESFASHGGWVVDQQFMDEMGSPFLLAHGLGKPVADAETTVTLPKGGYRLWVRTRNWVANWGVQEAPGLFQIWINNEPLDTVFGRWRAEWSWQDAGIINIVSKETKIKLRDLTGFEGRCDALFFTRDLKFVPPASSSEQTTWRRKLLGTTEPENVGKFDFVVTGGGIAGVCAAISAARLGLKVALIQDRPVYGGNNSSEVRVWAEGAIKVEPYKNLGNIVKEIIPTSEKMRGGMNARNPASIYADSTKLKILEKKRTLCFSQTTD